jgi:hypothetical protein
MMLITLEAMKEHLQMDHDEDDDDIERKIKQASRIVLDNLDDDDLYLDSGGEVLEDSDGEIDVPETVKAAVTLLTQMLYKGELVSTDMEGNYLPAPVKNLLYPRKLPAMA